MKLSLLLIVFLSVGCGKIETTGGPGSLGEIRQLQRSDISTADALIFDGICQSLVTKASRLGSSLPNALQFDVVEKDCSGSTVTFGTQQVRVEKGSGGEFFFRRQDTNALFVFPNVETSEAGLLKGLCTSASKMPLLEGESAIWISRSGFSGTDCPSNGNEVCLAVEHGLKVPDSTDSYRIHSREFIRFNVTANSGKYGYFTYRKSFAANNCDDGKFTESSASLR